MVGRQNLFLLRLGVATFRFQHTVLTAIFAQKLLTATRIVSIFNDILTTAISTSVNNKFGDHAHYYESLQLNHYLNHFMPEPTTATGEIALNVPRAEV